MSNYAKFSRAANLDIFAWREQPLNATNSTVLLSWKGVPEPLDTATTITFEVFDQKDFQAAAPILSFSKAGGTVVGLAGGFNLSVAGAVMDIEAKTYYYNLKADGELLLVGKFTIGEFGEQL